MARWPRHRIVDIGWNYPWQIYLLVTSKSVSPGKYEIRAIDKEIVSFFWYKERYRQSGERYFLFFWRANKEIMRNYKKCTLHSKILSKNKYILYKETEGVSHMDRGPSLYRRPILYTLDLVLVCHDFACGRVFGCVRFWI